MHQLENFPDRRVGANRQLAVWIEEILDVLVLALLRFLLEPVGVHVAPELTISGNDENPRKPGTLEAMEGRAGAVLGIGDGTGGLHDVGSLEHFGDVHVLDEVADILIRRLCENLFGVSDLHHPAVFHEDDAVAHLEGLVQIVGDEDDGLLKLLFHREELILHFGPDERIEGTEGLVHEKDVRVGGERPGQPHALLHAATHLFGQAVFPALEPDRLQGVGGRLIALIHLHALNAQAVSDILEDRHVGKQGEMLEHHAHSVPPNVSQRLLVHGGDLIVVHPHAPGGRLDQAIYAANQRGLAAAGEAHYNEHLPLPDVEARIDNAHCLPGFRQDLRVVVSLRNHLEGAPRLATVDLVDRFDTDFGLIVRHDVLNFAPVGPRENRPPGLRPRSPRNRHVLAFA